jgi:3-hydroxybutyryl-CoA dehydratase
MPVEQWRLWVCHHLTMRIFAVGDEASLSKTISETDIVLFAGLSGDFNPLHISETHAKRSRFRARIAHGGLVAALISGVVGNQLPGFGSVVFSTTLKFLKPAYIGDTVTATVTVKAFRQEKALYTLLARCHNQHHELLCQGEMLVLHEYDPIS